MRQDGQLRSLFRELGLAGVYRDLRGVRQRLSLSGNERNALFVSDQAQQFYDLSGLSGLDHPADGRVFALWDYNRDGWQDIAVVNANAPLLLLYRNQIATTSRSSYQPGQMIAVRLVGGQQTATPSDTWSARDGYGAAVTLRLDDMTIQREHRCGEGFAAQNSATMILGMGTHGQAQSVSIRWPSGRVMEIRNIPAGTLLTVYENPAHSPSGQSFAFQPYRVDQNVFPPLVGQAYKRFRLVDNSQSSLRLYTTMATWCSACKKELPKLQLLREAFPREQVDMVGIPIDEHDTPAQLAAYIAEHHPTYELRMNVTADEIAAVQNTIKEALKQEGLPASIITDRQGKILHIMWGVPSISVLHKLIANGTPSSG